MQMVIIIRVELIFGDNTTVEKAIQGQIARILYIGQKETRRRRSALSRDPAERISSLHVQQGRKLIE